MMSNHKIFTSLLILMSAPVLASCATAIEGSTQQISFKAVGADDARCNIEIGANEYTYEVNPPQSIWVQKSRRPMFVICNAPGNRTQNVTVMSEVAGYTFGNVLSGGLGAAWDGASGAMYKYPDEVIIDFSAVPAKDQYLPSYENNGALDPRKQGIEDMGPETPAVSDDAATSARYKAAYAEADRLAAEEAAMEAEKQRRIDSLDGGFYGDKGGSKKAASTTTQTTKSSDMELIPYDAATAGKASAKANTSTPKISPSPLQSGEAAPDSGVVNVPSKAPKLGEPLFPSTTSF